MTIDELRGELERMKKRSRDFPEFDEQIEHGTADSLLLEYIGDREVTKLFLAIPKWYG